MAKFRKLLRGAVVVPVNRNPSGERWTPQALGSGTVVELIDERLDEPSPFGPGEILVRFKDAGARDVLGWLARHTPLKACGGPLKRKPYVADDDDDQLSSYDWVRDQAMLYGWREKTKGLSPLSWLVVEGPKDLGLLRDVVRELGGTFKKSDDAHQAIRRVARLVFNREVSMAEVEEARDAATAKSGRKGSKKAKGKKSTEKTTERAERRPAGVGVGAILVPLLKGGAGAKLAKRLANGDQLKKKELTELRDAINEAAATAREKKQGKVSSALSAANRQVRRLARAA